MFSLKYFAKSKKKLQTKLLFFCYRFKTTRISMNGNKFCRKIDFDGFTGQKLNLYIDFSVFNGLIIGICIQFYLNFLYIIY